jgi:hypothetical protein
MPALSKSPGTLARKELPIPVYCVAEILQTSEYTVNALVNDGVLQKCAPPKRAERLHWISLPSLLAFLEGLHRTYKFGGGASNSSAGATNEGKDANE